MRFISIKGRMKDQAVSAFAISLSARNEIKPGYKTGNKIGKALGKYWSSTYQVLGKRRVLPQNRSDFADKTSSSKGANT